MEKTKTAMQQAIDALTIEAHNFELESCKNSNSHWENNKLKTRAFQNYSTINFLVKLRDTVEKEQIIDAHCDGQMIEDTAGVTDAKKYYEQTYGNKNSKKKCINCGSDKLIMFTADDDICQDCEKIQ